MSNVTDGLSPGWVRHDDGRLLKALAFWAGLAECQNQTGETHGGLLGGLKAELDDILSREPIDLNRVDSLTAEAAILLTGTRKF